MAPMEKITDQLIDGVGRLKFGPPTSHVYNPLIYGRAAFRQYCQLYGQPEKEVLLLGMNPGPWGMAQTGVPFGDVSMVRQWLNIQAPIAKPEIQHPKRPVKGFDCPRKEVSGQRLWGWAKDRFGTPKRFFRRFWVANYCPLVFMEASGRNRTPDKLPKLERGPLLDACDQALIQTVQRLRPRLVVGVGKFAALQAQRALGALEVKVGQITHPSPANPKANQGWRNRVEKELDELGIQIDT